ncbi:MAG: hypothetical protein K2G55_12020 [Lachnospiraceae bacterium]|nr:hypothetical protein [Lachnospiraceae bacterium]MDE7202181.1 hypothetical protein [Lachnospiraceae bacterium]
MSCNYRTEKCEKVSVSGVVYEFNDRNTVPKEKCQYEATGDDEPAYKDGKYHIKSKYL